VVLLVAFSVPTFAAVRRQCLQVEPGDGRIDNTVADPVADDVDNATQFVATTVTFSATPAAGGTTLNPC
jgi:hypothetical protein